MQTDAAALCSKICGGRDLISNIIGNILLTHREEKIEPEGTVAVLFI